MVKLDGFSDSDWAGSTDQTSQSSGALFTDGAPLYTFSRRPSVIATSSGMAEFYAGCSTAEEMLFGCQVEAALHMDSATARGICRREGVGKVKALEARALRLHQVVKAKTLTVKTVKSQDNCADLGTKTLAVGTLSLLGGLSGFVDKSAMHNVSRAVRAATMSSGESRKLRASALLVLEQALDEIARNGHGRSQRGTELRGHGLEQVIMKSGLLAGVESLGMPAHLPSLFDEKQSQRGPLAWLEVRACRRRA